MASAIPTRFMIISDTLGFRFENRRKAGNKVAGNFKLPLPNCDVLLHCGNLTRLGQPKEVEKCLRMLGKINAELKLVIAGNHERVLDKEWWSRHNENTDDPDSPASLEYKRAVDMMTGPLAKEAGVTYLTEGLNTFTLNNGAQFRIYSSPYSPRFFDSAFAYGQGEDRFNPANAVAKEFRCIAENPMPNFPALDIVMTHGPPRFILDRKSHGNVGCESLMRAVSRARPLLHCFGHVEEAYGARWVRWEEDLNTIGQTAIEIVSNTINAYPQVTSSPMTFGKDTLMVNAAIGNGSGHQPTNAPWLVDLDLTKAPSV
ncbi:Metallophosphoesterase domain-containing protein [Lachnellula subtilissima]|uniref:Metallophosphoesterase domain-containing protein n=1 Tax=Lachnellula subtilissima TaxID=602034 RepID=A0A8H8RCB8_9HELO|nr:Metallophosphoesterase domain-containing protein [Lachnellula subtilissima]